jgi:hypothetical protein
LAITNQLASRKLARSNTRSGFAPLGDCQQIAA